MSQTTGVSIALREINKQAYCNYYHSYFIYVFCSQRILTSAIYPLIKSVCIGLISRLKPCINKQFSQRFLVISNQ